MLGTQATLAKGQREPTYILEGIVVTGSWNAQNGTIKITEGAGYAQLPDSGSEYTPIEATLLMPDVGQCGPPRGGEQVCFCRTQGGWVAWFDNCFQQSIPAKAGEWWQVHYDADGNIDAYIKLTNDAFSDGDDEGSLTLLVGALLSIATAGGLMVVARDDTSLVGVGDDPANMGDDQAVIRKTDLSDFADNIKDWANANFQSGTGSAGDGPDVPDGSSTVLAKD
jgi:hypothetical protein